MTKQIFLLICLFSVLILRGQTPQLRQYEYWFDDDFAARVAGTLAASSVTFQQNVETNTLALGIHTFNIRFKDENNKWSSITTQYFYKRRPNIDAKITAYEYWFDGNTIELHHTTTSPQTESPTLSLSPSDIITLSLGIHSLAMRFQDAAGQWSCVTTQYFYKRRPDIDAKIIAYEYWFDDNTTERHHTSISPQVESPTLTLSPDEIAALPLGMHSIALRFQDATGQWSSVTTSTFIKIVNNSNNTITDYEYWFDDDGANRQRRNVISNGELYILSNLDLVQATSLGQHILHIRFRDATQQWSSVTDHFFIKKRTDSNAKIAAYEYWFDDQATNRIRQTINPPTDLATLNSTISNDNLSIARHKLNFRAQNTEGVWSSVMTDTFKQRKAGVTVIVHGFQLDGNMGNNWRDFAKAIRQQAGNGNIYKNDPVLGGWFAIDGLNSGDTTQEIILIYDWANLSNNGLVSGVFAGNGYLESAADNLFAMLHASPNVGGQNVHLLSRPFHFIAHSRGTVLTLQTLHRLRKYYPTLPIKHVTVIDPHPAANFGDVNSELGGAPPNLPCVYGKATTCSGFSCSNGNNIYLRMPDNVVYADNYYRRDGDYEGLLSNIYSIAAFDGVDVNGLGTFNRELLDNVIANSVLFGCSFLPNAGGAHSKIHAWYYGTVDSMSTATYDNCIISNTQPTSWYTNAFVNGSLPKGRFETGYANSRLGLLNYPDVASNKVPFNEMEQTLTLRTGGGLKAIFNGNFQYGDGGSGWTLNGGVSNLEQFSLNGNNRKAALKVGYTLQHSYFYFVPNMDNGTATNFNYLKFKFNVFQTPTISNPRIGVIFKSLNGIAQQSFTTLMPTTFDGAVYCAIPPQYQKQVGTFEVYITDGIALVDDFEFVNETPVNSSIVINNTVLPIDLVSFSAKNKGVYNRIEWTTFLEKELDSFQVERSDNGKSNWSIIGRVTPLGNNQNYILDDKDPLTISYYRLRTIEKNGKEQFSRVVAIEKTKPKGNRLDVLQIFPQPATEQIIIDFLSESATGTQFQVFDWTGRLHKEGIKQALEGLNQIQLDVSSWASGIYIFRLQGQIGQTTLGKMIIQK